MMKYLQKLGKSLMLPVAVLPVCSILMGIGYWIDPTGWGANSAIAAFLIKAGVSYLLSVLVLVCQRIMTEQVVLQHLYHG